MDAAIWGNSDLLTVLLHCNTYHAYSEHSCSLKLANLCRQDTIWLCVPS